MCFGTCTPLPPPLPTPLDNPHHHDHSASLVLGQHLVRSILRASAQEDSAPGTSHNTKGMLWVAGGGCCHVGLQLACGVTFGMVFPPPPTPPTHPNSPPPPPAHTLTPHQMQRSCAAVDLCCCSSLRTSSGKQQQAKP